MGKIPKNMYQDNVKSWNVVVGCKFDCIYCKKSFQAQMKRQKPLIDKNGKKRGCHDCYDYKPHFHEERLKDSLPNTKGDEFIWACASGDISFAKKEWIKKILERIRELPHKIFFFQTKNPVYYRWFTFPKNVILGITLESNREFPEISKAPNPLERAFTFSEIEFSRKIITIEPIMKFNLSTMLEWIRDINPMRVYIGYDTKKTKLPEPTLKKTLELIEALKKFTVVKPKLLREAWDK